MDGIIWLPIVISIFALLFAIFSFWWMHWRTGNLIVSKPFSYRAAKMPDGGIAIDLPFHFYNNGAAPIIVENLYLKINYNDIHISLFFNNTRNSVEDSALKTATQFVINGRDCIANVYSFQVRGKQINISIGKWDCELFGKINKKYNLLAKFPLDIRYFNDKAIPHLNLDEEYRKIVERP
jgi:hypothetical protein